jgi:rubrerythrin
MALEYDAIAAYDAVIERLDDDGRREKIRSFKADHEAHLSALRKVADDNALSRPEGGDMKELLTTGKIKMANLVGGDAALLKAMATNETDTVTAYAQGCDNPDLPDVLKPICEKALEDEKRHKSWMEAEAQAA